MIFYITRNGGGTITSQGLNGLSVWVKKPIRMINLSASEINDRYFMFDEKDKIDPKMKGYQNFPDHLLKGGYWAIRRASSSKATHSTPFGDMFGYSDSDDKFSNDISKLVWEEVNKEFNNEPFDDWFKLDNKNLAVYGESKFMLKLTIDYNGFVLENISDKSERFEYETDDKSQHIRRDLPF